LLINIETVTCKISDRDIHDIYMYMHAHTQAPHCIAKDFMVMYM